MPYHIIKKGDMFKDVSKSKCGALIPKNEFRYLDYRHYFLTKKLHKNTKICKKCKEISGVRDNERN